jgi:hypothetical protein
MSAIPSDKAVATWLYEREARPSMVCSIGPLTAQQSGWLHTQVLLWQLAVAGFPFAYVRTKQSGVRREHARPDVQPYECIC